MTSWGRLARRQGSRQLGSPSDLPCERHSQHIHGYSSSNPGPWSCDTARSGMRTTPGRPGSRACVRHVATGATRDIAESVGVTDGAVDDDAGPGRQARGGAGTVVEGFVARHGAVGGAYPRGHSGRNFSTGLGPWEAGPASYAALAFGS